MIRQPVPTLATDEDMAARFRADYLILCDREYLAAGTDGVFAAGLPWTLTSASNPFALQGVAPGNVAFLKSPASSFGSAGMAFAVDSVAGNSATLRRLNLATGIGMPPAPPAGLTGVSFLVPSLGAQIEGASYDIGRRFGIVEGLATRTTGSLADPRELRDAVVLAVATKRYFDLARQVEGNDVFLQKAHATRRELDDLLSRLTVHWAASADPNSSTGRFDMPIIR